MAKLCAFFTLLLFAACSSPKTASESDGNEEKLEVAVERVLGPNVTYQSNADKSYMLCSASKTEDNVSRIVFLVYDLDKREVIYQSTEQIRKVSWQSKTEVRADLITGIPVVESSNDYYVYNVETKKKELAPRLNRE